MEEAERLAHQIAVLDRGEVIAGGTAKQLKDTLGGDRLEATVTEPADLDRATNLLAGLAQARPHVDPDQRRVSVPTSGGTAFLLAAGHQLEEERITLDDLGIRRPSLDDVFLSLTGAPASRTGTEAPAKAAS
jgi:ABC-2 type transport system ATP-binding protein